MMVDDRNARAPGRVSESDDALRSARLSLFPSATRSFRSRSHDALIRVYDEAGNVITTHEDAG
jgi:hypothetical protein